MSRGQLPGNILEKFESRHSSAELKKLEIPFDFAKPSALIKYLMGLVGVADGDIVLDFFAGSGSTGHAAMELSAETGQECRFVCVQLPEKTGQRSEERELGFDTISAIAIERLRRVAAGFSTQERPVGFRVFRLDSSNIVTWDPDFEDPKEALFAAGKSVKDDRSEPDILSELLLKFGLELSVPIESRSIAGANVSVIGDGALVVCLSDAINQDVVEGIAALREELSPEVMRVVFKDSGFFDDVVKTNAVQTLRQSGIEDVKSL